MTINVPHMETIKNTAKLFGLPEFFIRQKAIKGEIVAVKAGCKYLINVDKLAEYLNTHTENINRSDDTKTEYGRIQPIPVKM